MAAAPTFLGPPKTGLAQILPADTTTLKTVVTAGASGTKVVSLMATSSDTAARIVQVYKVRSSVTYLLGTVTVPITAGFDGTTPAVDLMNLIQMPGLAIDNDGQKYLLLQSGDTLSVAVTVTVTAAKVINVAADYGDV